MSGTSLERLTLRPSGVDSRALMNRDFRKNRLTPAHAQNLALMGRNEIHTAVSERSVGYPIFGQRAGDIA